MQKSEIIFTKKPKQTSCLNRHQSFVVLVFNEEEKEKEKKEKIILNPFCCHYFNYNNEKQKLVSYLMKISAC